MTSDVFVTLKKGTGKGQLICFPYLGGYANSYTEIANLLGDNIEVLAANPPGHGNSKLPLVTDVDEIVQIYAQELKKVMKPDCVFFGHSMGGVIAYLMASYLQGQDETDLLPQMLFLSGCGTPDEFHDKQYSELSDEDLINQLITYGGMPDEVLNNRDLLTYLLPIFRADYKVLESAAQKHYPPIEIPTYLLWGDEDAIEPFDTVLQWSGFFKNNLKLIPVNEGKHMFVHNQAETVIRQIMTGMKVAG